MADLIGNNLENVRNVLKDTKKPINSQENVFTPPSDEVLEVASLQVTFPNIEKSKSSKKFKPPKVSVSANVFVPKIIFVSSKPSNKAKEVMGSDSYNINQALETMNICNNPQSGNNIDKILYE